MSGPAEKIVWHWGRGGHYPLTTDGGIPAGEKAWRQFALYAPSELLEAATAKLEDDRVISLEASRERPDAEPGDDERPDDVDASRRLRPLGCPHCGGLMGLGHRCDDDGSGENK